MISIKLPNFFENNELNRLKSKMGIDKHTYGNFNNAQTMSIKIELETKGIDIEDVSSITPLDDYTLSYNGERIILYIRDIADYSDSLPKYHVANCSTLQNMFRNGRKKRYVASQNETGMFHINIVKGNAITKKEIELYVCKNCLSLLSWENYSKNWSDSQKNQCVQDFTISDFFEKYPKSPLQQDGYSNENSPINQYPKNWNIISYNYRNRRNWTCEQCGVNLKNNKKLLHTHHINAQKNECYDSNLKALCVECHAKQPMHHHMHSLKDIDRDIQQIKNIRNSQNKSY